MAYLRVIMLGVLALCGCAGRQLATAQSAQLATPQIAYRIDAARYFEVVPLAEHRCSRARLYYNDTKLGIHADVASWDRVSNGTLVIDASNADLLIGPVILSEAGCHTGDSSSFLCASRIPFSLDSGRTWRLNVPRWEGYDAYMSGKRVYTGGASASIQELRHGYVPDVWQESELRRFPGPGLSPIDSKLQCNPNQ